MQKLTNTDNLSWFGAKLALGRPGIEVRYFEKPRFSVRFARGVAEPPAGVLIEFIGWVGD